MKKRYFIFCLLLLPILGWGQGFEAIFGSATLNFGHRVIQIPNENAYLALYHVYAGVAGEPTGLGIAKFNAAGDMLWQKVDDAELTGWNSSDLLVENDGFHLVYRNIDGIKLTTKKFNFEGDLMMNVTVDLPQSPNLTRARFFPDKTAIAIANNQANYDLQLFKINQNGSLQWTVNFPITQYTSHMCHDIITMADGSFLTVTQPPATTNKLLISKFNQSGILSWQGVVLQEVYSKAFIRPFPDGNSFFVWGDNALSVGGIFGAIVSNNGQQVWHQDFTPICEAIEWNGVIPGDGNTLYLTGSANNGSNSKLKLLQLANDGNIIWERVYGDDVAYNAGQVIRTQEGGLLVATAARHSQGLPAEPYILKTDADGEPSWHWQIAQMWDYSHNHAIQTSDGGYLVLGTSEETLNKNAYLTKITAYGSVYDNLIKGHLVHDSDLSCTQNNGETTLADWKVKATGSQTTYANTYPDGSFYLPTNGDAASVTLIPPNGLWTYCPSPANILFDDAPNDTTNLELFAQATRDCPILEVDVSTPFLRRCFENTYTIHCKNTGTIPAENTQIKVYLDPYFEYIDASIPLASQNGIEYIFDIGTLGIGEAFTMTVKVKISCDAELGQSHCLSVGAVADNTCPDIDNSLAQTRECQPNIGSFDPNDKRAFSEGKLVERFIAADSIIEYQIRFQNTGTDTAFTVVIADTLSSLLNIESIIAGAASHPYHLELERNNILKFIFNDIMLPDSNVNEPASHGFVKFRIRHKPGLVPGDVIPNKAAIFFDFNEAVITNNLELEIKSPTSFTHARPPIGQRVLVYPQPALDVVVFERLDEPGNQPCRLQITNLLGQVIYDQAMVGASHRVQGLPTGQHFYRLRQNGETLAVGKLVVVGQK